uniref:Uncharacterized protein n=1 Tax=viral metagenome TaxID=1070528 RepID=A0A6H2A5Q9_9ZZZZ
MAAECTVSIIAEVTGLGQLQQLAEKFSVTTTPTAVNYSYITQTTADTAQILELGDVSTVHLIIIKCVSNDLSIDTSYVSSFNAEISCQEGEVACFKPSGTVWVKNEDAGEASVFEVLVIGVT